MRSTKLHPRQSDTSVFRSWVLRLLVVSLVAPLLALAPSTSADAQGVGGYPIEVPQRFGIAANQSDRFSFGTRVSSNQVSAQGFALLAQICEGEDDTLRVLDDNDELFRSGTARVKPEDQAYPLETVGPNLAQADPGYRWEVTYCHNEVTTTDEETETCTIEDVVVDYGTTPWTTEAQEVCVVVPGESETTTVNTYISHRDVIHRDAYKWVYAAAKAALDQRDDLNLDEVWWNSSPGYNSRQIVALPTFLAASPVGLEVWETGYNWEAHGFPLELVGEAGGDEDDREIEITLVVSTPRSEWHFEESLGSLSCPASGRLWTTDDVDAVKSGEFGDDVCVVYWDETAVATDDIEKVKLESVQLLYPYQLEANASARVIAELISTNVIQHSGEFTTMLGPSGEIVGAEWAESEFGTETNGDPREMIVGEVQTYGVTSDLELLEPDLGADASPWVEPLKSTCQKAGDLFIIGFLAGPICKFVAGVINAHIAVLTTIWDGVELVATVAKVIASGLWSLIKGCLSLVGDLFSDLKETAESFIEGVQDPSGALKEISDNVSLIREQLANEETRGDFVKQVLVDFGAELISLDMIMDRSEDGEWTLQEDLSANDWIEWGGRLACEVIAAFFGGKIKEAFKGTKFAQRIQDWLTRRGLNIPDLDIPDTLLCLTRGAQYLGVARDAYEVSVAAAQANAESNSFLAGTLVLMADGSHEPIESISVGDVVLSYDSAAGLWEPQPVLAQWSATDDGQLATATMADGSTVTATDGHLFWVESRGHWTELEDLNAGDLLLTPAGPTEVATLTETAPAETEVWELSVADNHNFAVYTGTTNVLVHNACGPRSGGGGGDGGSPAFRQDPDGNVHYDSDLTDVEIDNVLLDADGKPVIIRTDDFEIVYHADGTVTVIDAHGNILPGGTPNADGSVTVTAADGSQTIIDIDGDIVTVPPGSPFVCNSFPTGTQVRLASGDYKNIEQIGTADSVLSYDFERGDWVTGQVTAQWSAVDDGVIGTVELTDGSTVSATDHHRFWNTSSNEWTELDQLSFGDELLTPAGTPTVAHVSLSGHEATVVWELTVESTNNFTVRAGDHDVLVHNCDITETVGYDGNLALESTNTTTGVTDTLFSDGSVRTTRVDGTTDFVDAAGNTYTDVLVEGDRIVVDYNGTPIGQPTGVIDPRWGIDSSWVDADGGLRYPANQGAVPGTRTQGFLPDGMTIDRYGPGPNGSYFSEVGDSFGSRAIPPNDPGYGPDVDRIRWEYEPRSGTPPLPVHIGEIAPVYGQPGGGTQFELDAQLIRDTYGPVNGQPAHPDFGDMLTDNGYVDLTYWFEAVVEDPS